MGKTKKQQPAWLPFLKGILLAAGIYLAGHLLLAALMVCGTLGEGAAFPVTAVLCVVASLCGALLSVRRCAFGPLAGGLLSAALFSAVLMTVGLLCWREIALAGRGGILLGCAIAGGVLAGFLGARRPKQKRRAAL